MSFHRLNYLPARCVIAFEGDIAWAAALFVKDADGVFAVNEPAFGQVEAIQGYPPLSHSAHTYGPGLTMAYSPTFCAVWRKAARSLTPEKSNSPFRGSLAFQNTYVCTVLKPARLS